MVAILLKRRKPVEPYSIIPRGFDVEYYQNNIVPQPGPQTQAHASSADILIYGGAAGGGKSRFLVAEPTRHVDDPHFKGVIFRESVPQIMGPEGLWDETMSVYPKVGGKARETPQPEWDFKSGAKIMLRHIGDEAQAMKDWQGLGAAYFGFDELTQFSRRLFEYIALSRGRSKARANTYIRGTCNPDPLSWVKEFLAPWLDVDFKGPGGPALPGEIRYFRKEGDKDVWAMEQTYSRDGMNRPLCKTVTFIPATVYDNKVLLVTRPDYLTSLENLGYVDKQRFLYADWNVSEAGNMFRKEWFGEPVYIEHLPEHLELCRFWDIAASQLRAGQKEPDYTAGALEGYDNQTGLFYMLDLVLLQETPGKVRAKILETAKGDEEFWGKYGHVKIRMEQEPGASGLTVCDDYANIHLTDYDFDYKKSTGSKVERAKPFSADAYHGRVRMLKGDWNQQFFRFAGPFPRKGVKDDPVDGFSGAHTALTEVDESVCPINPSQRYAGMK